MAGSVRRLINRTAVLRLLVGSGSAQRLIQALRGALVVREPLRFFILQLATRHGAAYRLRGSGLTILLRHRTRDIDVLNEIFGGTAGRQSYAPPPAVASALDASGAPKVLDLGANIGLFGAYVLSRWPGAEVRSYEPDPANLNVLTSMIAVNRLEERWSVAGAAVANQACEMRFARGLCADSHLLEESPTGPVGQTISVRAVDVFAEDHDVDVMKMDIEGGEWAVLTDPRLATLKAGALVLEWHSRGCPEPDARAATIRLLRAAGYARLEEVETGAENGLIWAW
jgi:FkbM family methyltransferase